MDETPDNVDDTSVTPLFRGDAKLPRHRLQEEIGRLLDEADPDVPEIDRPAIKAIIQEIITDGIDDAIWLKIRREDREAILDEKAFRRRFGFVVNQDRRQKVMTLKYEADLTDREIRLLWWTSNLDLNHDKARITSSRFLQCWGYTQVGVLCLLMLVGVLAATNQDARGSLSALMTIVAVEAALVALLGGVDRLYIRPNQIRLRTLR